MWKRSVDGIEQGDLTIPKLSLVFGMEEVVLCEETELIADLPQDVHFTYNLNACFVQIPYFNISHF